MADLVVVPDEIKLAQGDEQKLTVEAVDEDGNLITGVVVTFAPGDAEMIDVTKLGVVQATGRSGVTYVRVSSGRARKDIPVTVIPVIREISVTPNPVVIEQGTDVQLVPVLKDVNGYAVPGAVWEYYSSNTAIVTVSTTGRVHSVGPRGEAEIWVESGFLTARIPVTVTGVPASLSIVPDPARVGPGRSLQLQAVLRDKLGYPIPGGTATFTGSKPGVGSVSASGLVTAGSTLGTFTVQATSGSFTAEATVEVAPVEQPNGVLAYTVSYGGFGVAAANGIAYVAGLGTGLARIDLATGSVTGTIAPSGYASTADVRFSADGTVAYVAGLQGYGVAFVDPASNSVTDFVPTGSNASVFAVAVAPNDGRVYLGGSGSIWVIDPASKTVVKTLTSVGAVNHFSVHPTEPYLYATDFLTATVHEIDATTMTVRRSFQVTGGAQGTAVSPDGTILYVGQESGYIAKVDLASGGVITRVAVDVPVFGLGLSPDGAVLYASGGSVVRIIDTGTLTATSTPVTGAYTLRRLAFSDDGSTVVAVSEGGKTYIIQ